MERERRDGGRGRVETGADDAPEDVGGRGPGKCEKLFGALGVLGLGLNENKLKKFSNLFTSNWVAWSLRTFKVSFECISFDVPGASLMKYVVTTMIIALLWSGC